MFIELPVVEGSTESRQVGLRLERSEWGVRALTQRVIRPVIGWSLESESL